MVPPSGDSVTSPGLMIYSQAKLKELQGRGGIYYAGAW